MPSTPPVRRASIVDVARRAGVSVGSVSNVLNRPEAVSRGTRERVESAIAELSFVRNGVARQLRAGTITTVGTIVLDLRNPYFTELTRGVEDRLALDDHTLMVASSDDDAERERRYLRLFEEHGVMGLLVVPSSAGTAHLEALRRRGVDVVLLDAPSTTPGLSSVSVDDEVGGACVGRHLLELGHDRITFLNGAHTIRQCVQRLTGLRRAVEEAGLDPDAVVREVRLPSLDARGGDALVRQLVEASAGRPPTAVFCVNDLVAIGVQRALRHLGGTALLSSVAVVGYDDIDVASELAVPLTSVRRPALEMGYRAADLLLAGSSGPREEHVVFQPELVVRSSSTHEN